MSKSMTLPFATRMMVCSLASTAHHLGRHGVVPDEDKVSQLTADYTTVIAGMEPILTKCDKALQDFLVAAIGFTVHETIAQLDKYPKRARLASMTPEELLRLCSEVRDAVLNEPMARVVRVSEGPEAMQ